MPTEIAEIILEKIKTLSPEQQDKVLKFVDGLQPASKEKNGQSLKDLWRSIDDRLKEIPEDAWDEIPTDGATNLDHYLYGAPKRK
jgi:hypothetical protein